MTMSRLHKLIQCWMLNDKSTVSEISFERGRKWNWWAKLQYGDGHTTGLVGVYLAFIQFFFQFGSSPDVAVSTSEESTSTTLGK